MKEIWKEITTKNELTYYVSNYGRVKCEDEILSIGHGMYMHKSNPKIFGVDYPYGSLWRTVYAFFGEKELNKNLHIHHIDCNRLNNHITNLIAVTPHEHRMLHNTDYYNGNRELSIKNKKVYKELSSHTKEYKDEWIIIKEKIINKENTNKVTDLNDDYTNQIINKRNIQIKLFYKHNKPFVTGRKCMHKDKCNKYVSKTEINKYLDDGWEFGKWQSKPHPRYLRNKLKYR